MSMEQSNSNNIPQRGDSFDLGETQEGALVSREGGSDLTKMLENPQQMMEVFNLNAKQVKNVRSIAVAAGTGAAHKYLSSLIGGPLAGLVGGFLSAVLADKILGKGE